MLVVSGRKRQREQGRQREEGERRVVEAARAYGAAGWPAVPGVVAGADRACSCDRMGCPDPGAHPVSAAWAMQASVDADAIDKLWTRTPGANVILPTGRVFDVFDVPADAGRAALERIEAEELPLGPVASVADERYLFFVATRGAPMDEDEWWTCQLDCSPESVAETPGMRWHCRDSYVVAPPSVLPHDRPVTWVRPPDADAALPDPLRLLEVLADACESAG